MRLLKAITASLMLSAPVGAGAQEFDIFDPDMALLHISKLHAIYAGVSQAINLNCGGNVKAYADRFIYISDTLPQNLRPIYAGMFGEAMEFGEAYKCNRTELNNFAEWENIYFEGLVNR